MKIEQVFKHKKTFIQKKNVTNFIIFKPDKKFLVQMAKSEKVFKFGAIVKT